MYMYVFTLHSSVVQCVYRDTVEKDLVSAPHCVVHALSANAVSASLITLYEGPPLRKCRYNLHLLVKWYLKHKLKLYVLSLDIKLPY